MLRTGLVHGFPCSNTIHSAFKGLTYFRNGMAVWLTSTTPENWEIGKRIPIWATKSEHLTTRAKKDDVVVFYVKGTGLIRGVFRITSDWFKAKKPMWADEPTDIKYPFQVNVEPIKIGGVVYNEIAPQLSFVSVLDSKFYLRAHGQSGVANLGRPIPDADLQIIINGMTELEEEKKEPATLEHEDIIAKLAQIGQSLGFESSTDTEDTYIAKGAIVDLVWIAKVANIGKIKYIFEVQKRGSIDSLLLNLLKAMNDKAVRRVIVVSDKSQLAKIEGEAKALSDDFKKLLIHIDIADIERVSGLVEELAQFRAKMELF